MQNFSKEQIPMKRARSLWKPIALGDQADVTVPVHLAYCGIVAALRHHADVKTSGLAVLAVETPDALDSYVRAGRLFLRQLSNRQGYQDPFVRSITQKKNDKSNEKEIFRRAAEDGKGILLCASLDDVDEELRLFADIVATIPKPTRRQISATFRRFGHVSTKAEEDMVANEAWTRLVYAFQPDRPMLTALRRLRDTAKRLQAGKTPAIRGGLKLATLHGFGGAGEWGLELERDLKDYAKGSLSWEDVDAGLLVSGPPGTGKTLFAEALANTCGVPLVAASAAQWQAAGYLNDFLKAMQLAFEEARSKAPCILFIDEIDSFGSRQIHDSQHADYKRQVINGLLELLDGYHRRAGIVVIGATNHPENLDPAITRPGRLDRHIAIPLPDEENRRRIFEQYSGIPVPVGDEVKFGRSTLGMSGASIKRMVRDAKRAARRLGEELRVDHVFSVARPLAQVPVEHIRLAAVHETGHAIVGAKLGMQLEGIKISDTIFTDGPSMMGGAIFATPAFSMRTKSYYLNQVSLLMAGIAAEKLMFGEHTGGGAIDHHSDLARATALATQIEACLGLGDSYVVEVVEERELARLRSINPSLRSAVQKLLSDGFKSATSILNAHSAQLVIISDMLQRHHSLAGPVIERILRDSMKKRGDTLEYYTSDAGTPYGQQ